MKSSVKNRSIILTGATGFLGGISYLRLKKAGAKIIGTGYTSDRLSKEGGYVYIDLTDPETFTGLNESGPFDTVVHCASILPDMEQDLDILLANEKMTFNLMDWAVKKNISHFVFMSSCCVYGYSGEEKKECSLPVPENIYAISKLACEHIVSTFAALNSIKVCSLRISAPYGPNQKAGTVINRFINQAARGETIKLMGSGNRSQDFIYETDVSCAVESAVSGYAEGVFNIASGRTISMKDLAEKVLSIFDRDKNSIRLEGEDMQEDFRGIYPIQSARQHIGYVPMIQLEDGLRKTARCWGLL